MKNIFYIIILINLFGCNKECEIEYEVFTEEEKSWLIYDVGDVLIYQNQDGLLDTFEVFKKDIKNEESVEAGFWPDAECYQRIYGNYNMINMDSTLPIEMHIVKKETEYKFILTPSIADMKIGLEPFNPKTKSIIINGNTYSDVYHFDRGNYSNEFLVKSVIINKNIGFVQYGLMDSTVWNFKEVIK